MVGGDVWVKLVLLPSVERKDEGRRRQEGMTGSGYHSRVGVLD